MVFAFYLFQKAPVFFNDSQLARLEHSVYKDSFAVAKQQYETIAAQKQQLVAQYATARDVNNTMAIETSGDSLEILQQQTDLLRSDVKRWINASGGDGNDTNYIFLSFVVSYLPAGLVGLLIAIIFLASWGSIAAALNSLASCTMVDFHRRISKKDNTPGSEYRVSQWYTFGWGIFCIIVAMFTYNIGNSLIEAVNILGSLFYGVILGVFLVAFFLKHIKNGNTVFIAALLAEALVLTVFILTKIPSLNFKMGFLWLNPIGALSVMLFSVLLNPLFARRNTVSQDEKVGSHY